LDALGEETAQTIDATAVVADGSSESLHVHGVDITNEAAVRVYEASDGRRPLSDPLTFLNHPDSVMLTRRFALRRGLAIGDGSPSEHYSSAESVPVDPVVSTSANTRLKTLAPVVPEVDVRGR
jgi:hypothetical protein